MHQCADIFLPTVNFDSHVGYDGGRNLLWNVDKYLQGYTLLHFIRLPHSQPSPRKSNLLHSKYIFYRVFNSQGRRKPRWCITLCVYLTSFLIWSHIPPRGNRLNDFFSRTNGTGVFWLTLNSYLDRRETSPTFICKSPNRMPEKNRFRLVSLIGATKIFRGF
jgi:hypothetical protein